MSRRHEENGKSLGESDIKPPNGDPLIPGDPDDIEQPGNGQSPPTVPGVIKDPDPRKVNPKIKRLDENGDE